MQYTPFDHIAFKVNAKTDDFLYLLAKELNIDIPDPFNSIMNENKLSETYDKEYKRLIDEGKNTPQYTSKETLVEEENQQNLLLSNIRGFDLKKLKKNEHLNVLL